jgi:hypothetical protein
MSKQDKEEDNAENTLTLVYLPDEGVYGTIVSEGVWASLIQYHENGIGYTIEVPNDEFFIVEEFGIGYINETEENL